MKLLIIIAVLFCSCRQTEERYMEKEFRELNAHIDSNIEKSNYLVDSIKLKNLVNKKN